MFVRSISRPGLQTPLFRSIRLASTAGPSSSRSVESTTFSEKSAPRSVHERPEQIRGFPPIGTTPHWKAQSAATGAPAPASEGGAEDFHGPSRPRLLYARPEQRELPKLKNSLPTYVALGVLGLSAWGLFLLYATNAERLASSVTRSLQFHLRNSAEVAAVMGQRIKLEEPWYILGDPWISGSVNTMQGRVDLKFRIKGSKDAGTIYFTAIRPSQMVPWRIVRYKLISDAGETLQLEDNIERI